MELTHVYAQITVDGLCFAVSCHSAPLPESPRLVRLEAYDETLLGRSYINGEWV